MQSMEKLVIGQTKVDPQKADGQLKSRQNYAPFRSLSPRFQENKTETLSSLPPIITSIAMPSNNRLHTLKTEAQSDQSQFFFKSRISRFVDEKINASTPIFYSQSRSATKQQISPNKKRLLFESRTIPSIPDCRNKFGYNCYPQSMTLVQKSQKQLEREHSLMKEYKDSLLQQKIEFKRQRGNEFSQMKAERQFAQKAKKLLQKQNLQERASISHDKGTIKPKYSHLYNWKPEGGQIQCRLPYFIDQSSNKRQQNKIKFQFFNSCEKRFKETVMNARELNRKANVNVRAYLQSIQNFKENCS